MQASLYEFRRLKTEIDWVGGEPQMGAAADASDGFEG
jgi:hypothetical protein